LALARADCFITQRPRCGQLVGTGNFARSANFHGYKRGDVGDRIAVSGNKGCSSQAPIEVRKKTY